MSLLQVRGLRLSFATADGLVQALNGVDLDLSPGGTLGVVGESGSGKSQLALALIGLVAGNGRLSGSIRFDGQELIGAPAPVLQRLRGARIGMVFQDPMTGLNPYLSIGRQLAEVLEWHRGASRATALTEARRMLDAVRLPDAARRLGAYSHQLSGGQRQRVMLAMALMARPALLIADEPTTALDVTVQAQMLSLLADLRAAFGIALLLITHDLGVVASSCERLLVMYAGQALEQGPTAAVLAAPAHPYTAALLSARPRLDMPRGVPLPTIPGQPPDLRDLPPSCRFAERCGYVQPVCMQAVPASVSLPGERSSACVRVAIS